MKFHHGLPLSLLFILPLALAVDYSKSSTSDIREEMELIKPTFRALSGSEDAAVVAAEYKREIISASADVPAAVNSENALRNFIAESLQRRPYPIRSAPNEQR